MSKRTFMDDCLTKCESAKKHKCPETQNPISEFGKVAPSGDTLSPANEYNVLFPAKYADFPAPDSHYKPQEDSSRILHPDDPSYGIPKNRLELSNLVGRGYYQPCLRAFPKKIIGRQKDKRSFHSEWYQSYRWLEYSEENDSAYCFPCRFFALNDSASCGMIDDAFITTGFNYWHKANEKFKDHEKTRCHQGSVDCWNSVIKGKPVDTLLNDAKECELQQKEIQRRNNREYMTRLIDTIRVLAKGGRSFRGYYETDDSTEKGLFLEIVNLFQKYDPSIKSYLEAVPKNCAYLSSTIQNDILKALCSVILRHISHEVEGQSVSIIADETSDVNRHEQRAVFIRYIPRGEVIPFERFLGLQQLQKTNAAGIFNDMKYLVERIGVSWENVVSVCFDGASTMAGDYTGVQARCKELNSSIVYIHCYPHCLNLTLVGACASHKNNPLIFDFFGIIQLIYNFIENSTTRHRVFKEIVKTLKSLSDTRWACRAEAVHCVRELLTAIIEAIEKTVEDTADAKVRAQGRGTLLQLKSFSFIVCLEIVEPILQMILKTSKTLQSARIDLCEAIDNVQSLAQALAELRRDEQTFDIMYSKVEDICKSKGILIPETRKRQVSNLLDQNADTATTVSSKKDEIKFFTYYPVLDSLLQGLNLRFSQETKYVISCVGKIMKLEIEDCTTDNIQLLSDTFNLNTSELVAEVRLLKTKKMPNFAPTNVHDWLKWLADLDRGKTYENCASLFQKFSVIPVSSCSCERSFSKMAVVKTKLRSTMKQERLNALVIPFVEQNLAIETNNENDIYEFKKMVPFIRRMTL